MCCKFIKPLIYVIIFIWAFFLLCLIPTFFYNYEGDWMEKIQEKIQIKN